VQVVALPQYYAEEYNGCTIPDQGYAGHGAPQEDSDVSVTVEQDGTPAMSLEPGQTYTVNIASYAPGTAVNMWLHTSEGVPTSHPSCLIHALQLQVWPCMYCARCEK
jgi:hypothetical protein